MSSGVGMTVCGSVLGRRARCPHESCRYRFNVAGADSYGIPMRSSRCIVRRCPPARSGTRMRAGTA
jgi:hypothetical protein